MLRVARWFRTTAFAAVALALLIGCATPRGDATRPIAQRLVAAPVHAQRLVVVLPGRRDDLERLGRSGVVEAIQDVWPDADVLLAELSLDYYVARVATQRLHEEVIEPARVRPYQAIWIVGASLGGTGALAYARDYPGVVDGLVLLAPYLGENEILREISEAGGVTAWNPDAGTGAADAEWQRELWRYLKTWSQDASRAQYVWLVYGDRDRLRSSMPLLSALLPADHVLIRRGGHRWRVWSPGVREILTRAEAK